MQIIVFGLLLLFTGFALFAWFIIRSAVRNQRERAEKESGSPIERPPTGLRILGVVQYPLAFIYGFVGLLTWAFPGDYHNGQIAPWVTQAVVFRLSFAILAVLSATGYANGSVRWGFKLGMTLGWMCVVNFFLVLLLYRPPSLLLFFVGIDPISLSFGITLLGLLHWRYRSYFEVEEPSPAFAKFSGAVVRGMQILLAILVVVPTTSLIATTVFPQDDRDASRFLAKIADSLFDHREEHGSFPSVLDDLDPPVNRYYRWHRAQYLPEELKLEMTLNVPREQDILSRMTFNMIGGRDRIAAVIRTLNNRPPQSALD